MPAKKTPKKPAVAAPPKEARVHPPLQTWLSNAANTEFLRNLLADPRFIAACHYAVDVHRVTSKNLLGPNAELSQVIVRKAALHAGAVEFVQTLASLPSRLKTQGEPEPGAWEHIKP